MRAIGIVAAVALALLPISAWAQPGPGPGAGCPRNASTCTVTATGGTTARTNANRALDVATYNVMDYGAFCDGNTNDTVAINATTAAARASQAAPGGVQAAKILFPPGKTCVATGPLNFTGFTSYTVYVDGQGATVSGKNTGGATIDAMGSRFMRFQNLTVYGDLTLTPKTGIQVGRTTGASADQFKFDNVTVRGNFTLAALYNLASETNLYTGVTATNGNASGPCYAVVQDGANHFNITSTFASVTIPPDTQQSFNEDTFVSLIAQTGGGCDPIWLDNTSRHQFIGGYASSAGSYGMILADYGTGSNDMLNVDVHFEPTTLTNAFLLTGSNVSPSLRVFRYNDHLNEASAAVFKEDTGITSVTMLDADIHIKSFTVAALPLLTAPSKWTISGNIYLPSAANFSQAASYQGNVCITTTCYPYVPATPLNRNPDFVLDQPSEGGGLTLGPALASGSTLTDGWIGLSTVLGSNRITATRTGTSPPAGYGYSWQLATQTTITPSAAQFGYMQSNVSAPATVGLQWGSAAAARAVLDLWVQANNTGTYPLALHNADDNRSYVVNCVIASANAWTRCTNSIPGDTVVSNWRAGQPGSVGIRIDVPWACGSNFQTTANAWQAGNFLCDSSVTNLSTLAAGTLAIAAVHLYPSLQVLPELPRPFSDELTLAHRYYRKTFPLGTAVAQSAGVAGAVCVRNPIANGEPSAFWAWDAPMFATPTITTYNPAAANANWRDVTGAADVTVAVDPTTAISNSSGIEIAAGATVATIAHDLCIHAVADVKN